MQSNEVIDFLRSWGLDAEDDDASISESVYRKMLAEAANVGKDKLQSFCEAMIDATDGDFYINVTTWQEVSEAWKAF
jgi:hypothetical protein